MQDQGRYEGDVVRHRSLNGEEIDVRHGQGTYHYANGFFTYTGDWVNGVKHGHGIFSCGSGSGSGFDHSVYEGQFVHGEMTGKGLKRWADGSNYSGQFMQGEMHGQGIFHGVHSKYEGSFRSNHRDGRGKLTSGAASSTGAEYSGEFFKGKRHGMGCTKWNDGSRYEGAYAFDYRDGEALETYGDSSRYEGHFHNDERSGPGTFQHAPSGMIVEGEFKYGAPLLQPTVLKLRVEKSAEMVAADAAAANGGLPSPTEGGASSTTKPGSAGKLSKKKQEEMKKAAEEFAAYRASLTEGFVIAKGGVSVQVIDEGRELTANPGEKLPRFFLCATNRDGTIAASESGRMIKVSIRLRPLPPPPELPADASARTKNAAAAYEPLYDMEGEEAPVVAFCTCPGAKLPLPVDPVVAAAAAAAAAASPPLSPDSKSNSGKKKKSGSAGSSAAKAKKGVVEDPNAPPPLFVCNGACIPLPATDRSQLLTSLILHTNTGFVELDELWLSGSCTSGAPIDLLVEDVTNNINPAPSSSSPSSPTSHFSPNASPRRHQRATSRQSGTGVAVGGSDELGPPPKGLTFTALSNYMLKLVVAGALPKRKKQAKRASGSVAAKTPKASGSVSASTAPSPASGTH